jgi:hypothetical protein
MMGALPVAWKPGSSISDLKNPDQYTVTCHERASMIHQLRNYDPDNQFVFNITKRNDPYDNDVDASVINRPNKAHGTAHKDMYMVNSEIIKQGPMQEPPVMCSHPKCGWVLLAGANAPYRCDCKCVDSVRDVFCDKECLDAHYRDHHKAHWAAIERNRSNKNEKVKARKKIQKQNRVARKEERIASLLKDPKTRDHALGQIALEKTVQRRKRKDAIADLDKADPDWNIGQSLGMREMWEAVEAVQEEKGREEAKEQ